VLKSRRYLQGRADFIRSCSSRLHGKDLGEFLNTECSRCESDAPGPPTYRRLHLVFGFRQALRIFSFKRQRRKASVGLIKVLGEQSSEESSWKNTNLILEQGGGSDRHVLV